MQKNLDVSLTYVLNDEGGYAERENEPGGACNKGISFLVFKEWRKKQGKPVPTFADLKAITEAEAKAIYTALFAKPLSFDSYPSGLDYVMLNTAVMQGVTGAKDLHKEAASANMLMTLLIQAQKKMFDLRCGPFIEGFEFTPGMEVGVLIEKLKKLDPKTKIKRGFGPGWSNRLVRVARRCMAMYEKTVRPTTT
jgi:hypothetical protein